MANDITVVKIGKVLMDIFLLNCVGWPILFLWLWGSGYHRGVFCEDETLQHPYMTNTVPSWSLYILGFGLNGIGASFGTTPETMQDLEKRGVEHTPQGVLRLVLLSAVCINFAWTRMVMTEFLNKPNESKSVVFLGLKVPTWVYNLYCAYGMFCFGAACSQLTTDVMKYTVGRLRPHFLTVCVPDICQGTYIPYKYYENYTCTNPLYVNDKKIMKELRLSFPSGHSSFSMYTMLYFAIYLQKRMTWDGSKLLKHTLQFVAVLSSVFIGMTRISDYKHHWSDVLAGLLLGASIASITAAFFSNLFSDPDSKDFKKLEPNELSNLNGNRTHV